MHKKQKPSQTTERKSTGLKYQIYNFSELSAIINHILDQINAPQEHFRNCHHIEKRDYIFVFCSQKLTYIKYS